MKKNSAMKKLADTIASNKRLAAVVAVVSAALITAAVGTSHSSYSSAETAAPSAQAGTTVAETEQAIASNPLSRAAIKENPGPASAAAEHAPNGLEGDPYHPAAGTQEVTLSVRDGKLASGPASVTGKAGGYVLFHITDNREDRAFFIDELGINAEVEEADAGGGTAYLKLDRAGTFTYGVRDQANPADVQVLGTLTVAP